MKKLLLLLIIVTTFSCCSKKEEQGVKKDNVQKFEDYMLVEVDGETFSIWNYHHSSGVYGLRPLHREGDIVSVQEKYVKSYNPKSIY